LKERRIKILINIFEEQNSELILKLLYSQRVNYNRAGVLNNINKVLILSNLILNFILMLIPNDYISLTILLLSLVTILIESKIKSSIRIGAATKEYIDQSLFKLSPSSKIDGYTLQELREFANKEVANTHNDYIVQISNTGNDIPPGVKDWYMNNEFKKEDELILDCQFQNNWWTKKLYESYLKISTIIYTIIGLITVLIIYILKPKFINIIIITGTLLLSFASKIWDISSFRTYKTLLNDTYTRINEFKTGGTLSKESLIHIQENIFKLRQQKYLIPNWLHKKKCSNYHNSLKYTSIE